MSKRKKARPARPKEAGASVKAGPAESFWDEAETWLAKNGRWLLLPGWFFFTALYLSLASDELGGVLGGDNARYLMLARALAQGKGYRDLYFPAAPVHAQYPFLFPLLLSVFAESSRQVFYSHILILVFASLLPLLACGWARLEGESRLKSLLVFFLVGSIPAWYSSLLNILTEAIFIFFMFLALFILSYAKRRGFDIYRALLLSLSIWASAMVREVGLVLFGAVLIGIFLDKDLRKVRVARAPLWALVSVVFVPGYGAWTVRNMLSGEGGFYFKQFLAKNPYQPELGWLSIGDFFARIKTNLSIHIPHLAGFAFPAWLFKSQSMAFWLAAIFLALLLLGLVSRLLAKNFAAEMVFIFFFGVAAAWYFQEERFSLPLLPLAGFYFVKGIDAAGKILRIKKPMLTVSVTAVIVIWQIGFMGWLCKKYHQTRTYPQSTVTVEGYGQWSSPVIDASKYSGYWLFGEEFWIGTGDWIVIQKVAGQILPKNAVIACRKPTLAWYFADRKATWYKFGASPEEQWEHFKRNNITHILVSSGNRELVEMIKTYPGNFRFLAVIQRSGLGLAELNYPAE